MIPEVPFTLEGFLAILEERLDTKGHAVIVVGEGAGQDLMERTQQRDASGNVRFGDIGIFLRDQINGHFKGLGKEINLKYIDPSYTIRSVPANAHDSAFCLLLGQNAVHAGMAGRTNMVVGDWGGAFTHIPIPMAVSKRKKIDPEGWNPCFAGWDGGAEPRGDRLSGWTFSVCNFSRVRRNKPLRHEDLSTRGCLALTILSSRLFLITRNCFAMHSYPSWISAFCME